MIPSLIIVSVYIIILYKLSKMIPEVEKTSSNKVWTIPNKIKENQMLYLINCKTENNSHRFNYLCLPYLLGSFLCHVPALELQEDEALQRTVLTIVANLGYNNSLLNSLLYMSINNNIRSIIYNTFTCQRDQIAGSEIVSLVTPRTPVSRRYRN